MKSHKLLASALSLVALAASGGALASDQTGPVSWVGLDNTGPYSFALIGTRSTKPACATDDAWAIIGPTTDSSKSMLSGVLTVYGTGKTMQVVGTGTCDATSPTREKVLYILIYR